MTTVVKFKPRPKKLATTGNSRMALEAIDKALGAEFERLARLYGAYAVSTVATRYVADCIRSARRKHREQEDKWVSHISKVLSDAVSREP